MQKKSSTTKPVGQHMLKLLTEKEQQVVAGGQRGPVRRPGNGCTNIPGRGGNACR